MSITLAETAGFCFGVNRAVEMVYNLLDEGKKVCTLGPIIHNPQIVEELNDRGVRIVESPDEVGTDEIMIIRSHGVPEDIYDRAEDSGVKIANATCPYVSKIHNIVANESKEGRTILIAGDPNHQEVIGIRGHCKGESFVFSDEESLEELQKEHPGLKNKPVSVVSQTTFNAELWKNCQKTFKNLYTNAVIFDTICNATAIRQDEAKQIASRSDMMIVIGGKHSSNTAKLKDVCDKYCKNTLLIETASELFGKDFSDVRSIGVVAGASTPARIIKEVLKTMSENLNPVEDDLKAEGAQNAEADAIEKSYDEMTFEEALEASLSSLNTDQKVRGLVMSVNPSEVQVDIGRKHAGFIPANEFSADPNAKLTELVKPGDELDLIVMRTNDQEGTVMLSKRRFDAIEGWNDIVRAKENNDILDGTVVDVVKGGVIAVANNFRVFIPASLATSSRGEDLENLKGTNVSFKIIEIGKGRRAVGSIRAVLREQRKVLESKFWESIEPGQTYTGVVKSITNYGAFVDLGGVDGMIHISELSWSRIKHPSEVLNLDDTVEVYIKDLDNDKKRISLGYRKSEDNPWEILKRDYPVGTAVNTTVVSITSYGAFARIIPGIDGLIHISQIADRHIEKPQDELTVGQEVDAKIINIDFEKRRVSLSIRALLETEENAETAENIETAENTESEQE